MFDNDVAAIENKKREEQRKLDIARTEKEIRNMRRERFMLSPVGRVLEAAGFVGKKFVQGTGKLIEKQKNAKPMGMAHQRPAPRQIEQRRPQERRSQEDRQSEPQVARMPLLPQNSVMFRPITSFDNSNEERRGLI